MSYNNPKILNNDNVVQEIKKLAGIYLKPGKSARAKRYFYILKIKSEGGVEFMDFDKVMNEGYEAVGILICSVAFNGWYVFDVRGVDKGGVTGFYKCANRQSAETEAKHLLTQDYEYFEKNDHERYVLTQDDKEEMGEMFTFHMKASEIPTKVDETRITYPMGHSSVAVEETDSPKKERRSLIKKIRSLLTRLNPMSK